MKSAAFSTTINDLKSILEDTKDLHFKLNIQTRPNMRDVLVIIQAEEDVLYDFIDRNDLSQAIGEIVSA